MRDRSAARHAGQPRPGAGHCLTGTVSARRQCGGSGGTVCGRKEAIGGGLLESPELRRAMACAVRRRGGDGVLTTPRCGRCLGYRPGGWYFKYRSPPGCPLFVRSGMCGPDQESLLFIFLVRLDSDGSSQRPRSTSATASHADAA